MMEQRATRTTVARTRDALLRQVKQRGSFSVVIVGAGINGLGAFHDLCLQGVDCLIVDRGDFCSGTSAAPSRMIHGGLKYLETGEFRLVRESVHERNRLLRNAPHLVRPLEMVIPIETALGGEVASVLRFMGAKAKLRRRGRWIVRAGLATYDFFSRGNRVAPVHRMMSGQDLGATLPGISGKFRYAASYYDAQIVMPERLGLELALDGMAANTGSVALNHCGLVRSEHDKLVLEDGLTGESVAVGAGIVINAAGPWIDAANASMNAPTRLIAGNKGSHVLLDLPYLHDVLAGRMIYFDPGDGRICLVTSLMGRVLLGSTDIPVTDASVPVCEDDEIDYMFDALRSVFPGLKVSRDNIVFTYSGVRPLPASDATNPGDVSRDHSINALEPTPDRSYPILSLIGGKWTTYRAFGAEAADAVLARLGRPRSLGTEDVAVGGGARLSARVEDWEYLIDEVSAIVGNRDRAWVLTHRYGSRALDASAVFGSRDRPLRTLPDISEGEIAFIAGHEMAATLCDVVLRRLPLALAGRLNPAVVEELADVMAAECNWSKARRQQEIASLEETLSKRHRINVRSQKFV